MKITRLVIFLLTGLVAFITTTLTACLLYIHFNREDLIRYFLEGVNEKLNTPIEVRELDMDYWQEFPQVSLVLQGVEAKNLVRVEKLSFSFGIWDFINKNYRINQLLIEEGHFNLIVDKKGRANFDIFKKGAASAQTADQLVIEKIRLISGKLSYDNQEIGFKSSWDLEEATVNLQPADKSQQFSVRWTGKSEETIYQDFSYLAGEKLEIVLDEVKAAGSGSFSIGSWQLLAANHQLSGNLSIQDKNTSIELEGKTASVKELLKNIPAGWPDYWPSYELEGSATFSGWYSNSEQGPQLELDFKGSELSFRYPSRGLSFSSFSGNGKLRTDLKASGTSISLSGLEGQMNGFQIKGKANLEDLENLYSRAELEGKISLALFEQIMPDWGIKSGSGEITYALAFDGRLDESASGDWLIDGEAQLENASFTWNNYWLPLRSWSGTFLFNDRDVAISDASGMLGNSSLRLNALLRNFHFFYEARNHLLLIEGQLKASKLDLNELLANQASEKKKEPYYLRISPRLQLFLEAEAERIYLDRFRGESARASLQISNSVLELDQLSFNSVGGQVNLSGSLTDLGGDLLQSSFSGRVKNLYIDSVFYVFRDFNQDWLQSRHLKGQIDAEFDVDMALRYNLSFLPDKLRARIDARGINGELVNFEPMKELSRLVDDEKLARLTFGELRNQFLIENNRVLIPSMEIRSNLSNIILSGTHTFDQQIDYRLKVPIINKTRKRDRDEAFGAIEEDKQGNVFAHVKITGTSDDYKVAYDSRSAARTVVDGLRKEGQELMREIRKEPVKKAQPLQLKEDEFFEFKGDTISNKLNSGNGNI